MLVLVNLALNSLDAMSDGGALTVRAESTEGGVRIAVADTGHGMEPAVLERACEPLYTTKAAARGTGLGLAVSRAVVENAGGTIAIRSTAGEGTEVTVHIPEQPDG